MTTKPDKASLTVREKLVLAAHALGEGTFRAQQLVVRAWEMFPESFSLQGHALPCSNTVYSKLSGRDGLVERGLLVQTGERRYALSAKGLCSAATLRGEPAVVSKPKRPRLARPALTVATSSARVVVEAPAAFEACAPLTDVELDEVARLLRTGVHQRAMRGMRLQLGDAFAFWSLRPLAGPDTHAARIARVEELLRTAMGPANAEPTGERVQAAALFNTHAVLRGRFAGALGVAQGYAVQDDAVAEGAAA